MRTWVATFGRLVAVLGMLMAGAAHAAPEKAAGGIRFTYRDAAASTVAWAGDANNWSASATPMTRGDDGTWSVVVPLQPGEHQYKFVVDGQWVADPENPVTGGDFGNSVVNVGADGALVATATANTPYSPKITLGGRIIGLYQDIHDDIDHRFELRRPNMDLNLDVGIRISDALRAHFLMDINSEKENVQDWRTRLNFDRGSLAFTRPGLHITAFDNDAIGTWDDPLHLVGDVGIYHHAYGYHREGFQAGARRWGFDAEAVYADNFDVGGTDFPAPDVPGDAATLARLVAGLPVRAAGGGWSLAPGGRTMLASVFDTDANEDMAALRVGRDIRRGLHLGLLGRMDRGFDLGKIAVAEATGDSTFRVVLGNSEQQWYAGGAELSWNGPHRTRWFAEALHGVLRTVTVHSPYGDAVASAEIAGTIDSSGVQTMAAGAAITPANGEHFDFDHSQRLKAGGEWTESHGDIRVLGEVEYQPHRNQFVQGGLHETMTVWHGLWQRNWRYYLNREVKTSLDAEYTNFEYPPTTPWDLQLWFPAGNFWLENGEHLVTVDRLALLGGADVARTRAAFEIPVPEWRQASFRWQGTFAAPGFDRRPIYTENVFQLGADVTHGLRLSEDARWVKYDAPVLGVFNGWVSHFAQLEYTWAPGTTLSLGWGVDPWVIDAPVNEFAPIGRDLYLFEHGASGAVAESNFYGLGPALAAAERALAHERRLQIKAVIHF